MSNEEPPREASPEAQPEQAPGQAPGPRRRGFRTGRLEAFSDGVFAIAVTLLILDIGVSGTASHDLGAAIRGLWPSYLAYIASFSTIGAAWLAHNAITEYLERADAAFVRLNLLLLLAISFLPFPTRLVAEFIRQDKAERVAVTFYGIVLLLSSTLAGVPFIRALRQSVPLYGIFFLVISIIIFFPDSVLWLPRLVVPQSVGCFANPSGSGYICPPN